MEKNVMSVLDTAERNNCVASLAPTTNKQINKMWDSKQKKATAVLSS